MKSCYKCGLFHLGECIPILRQRYQEIIREKDRKINGVRTIKKIKPQDNNNRNMKTIHSEYDYSKLTTYELGTLYGWPFFVKTETEEQAQIIADRFRNLTEHKPLPFIQRLKYLFTNR